MDMADEGIHKSQRKHVYIMVEQLPSNVPEKSPTKVKAFTEATITVGPGRAQSLGLGAYDAAEPMPLFDLAYDPNLEDLMGASLERLDIPGKAKYIAVYHFHNFSDKTCCITVRRHR